MSSQKLKTKKSNKKGTPKGIYNSAGACCIFYLVYTFFLLSSFLVFLLEKRAATCVCLPVQSVAGTTVQSPVGSGGGQCPLVAR
jgi:hypothetical protein